MKDLIDEKILVGYLLFKAIENPKRLQMLRFIANHPKTKGLTLSKQFDLIQPHTSRHLKKLLISKLIIRDSYNSYSINAKTINHILFFINGLQ